MIELTEVCKSYPGRSGRRRVLDRVYLRVARGERWGILGRNGSGKSTLVRVLAGAELPDSGRVSRRMRVSWPLAFGGGFQGGLTGLDNARFIARIYGAREDRVVREVEAFAELGRALREPVANYSSGMRARLAFGLSLAIDFDALLIDEITAVGDHQFRRKCDEALFEKRPDRGWILVTHDFQFVRAHCGRVAVLLGGRLHDCADMDEAQRLYEGASHAPV